MSEKDFNRNAVPPSPSSDEGVAATRQALNGRIGEIITAIIGDDRLQSLFEGKEITPESQGKPSGEIALDLGVITRKTKNALLVAQAAQRAYEAACKAEGLIDDSETIVTLNRNTNEKQGRKTGNLLQLNPVTSGVVSCQDPVFAYVGDARDPKELQDAQGLWMLAQMYLNKIVGDINLAIVDVKKPVECGGGGYITALKKMAGFSFGVAAEMLTEEGHNAAAEKIYALGNSLDASNLVYYKNRLAQCIEELTHDGAKQAQKLNMLDNILTGEGVDASPVPGRQL